MTTITLYHGVQTELLERTLEQGAILARFARTIPVEAFSEITSRYEDYTEKIAKIGMTMQQRADRFFLNRGILEYPEALADYTIGQEYVPADIASDYRNLMEGLHVKLSNNRVIASSQVMSGSLPAAVIQTEVSVDHIRKGLTGIAESYETAYVFQMVPLSIDNTEVIVHPGHQLNTHGYRTIEDTLI